MFSLVLLARIIINRDDLLNESCTVVVIWLSLPMASIVYNLLALVNEAFFIHHRLKSLDKVTISFQVFSQEVQRYHRDRAANYYLTSNSTGGLAAQVVRQIDYSTSEQVVYAETMNYLLFKREKYKSS